MSGRVRSTPDDGGSRDAGVGGEGVDESSNSSTRAFHVEPEAAGEDTAPDRRRGRRSRLRWLLATLVAVVVLAGAAVAVWAFPVFTVSEVAVEGNEQVTREQIVEAAGVAEGENLLRVDEVETASHVVGLPRIREATVARSLPDTVTVTVVERRVVAWLDDAGSPVLIDEQGTPFTDGGPPPGAVRIEGVGREDEELLDGAVDVAASLSPETAGVIDHLRVDGPAEYVAVLTDGRSVFWGAPTDNHNKAVALETVIQRPGESWDISNPTMVTSR